VSKHFTEESFGVMTWLYHTGPFCGSFSKGKLIAYPSLATIKKLKIDLVTSSVRHCLENLYAI